MSFLSPLARRFRGQQVKGLLSPSPHDAGATASSPLPSLIIPPPPSDDNDNDGAPSASSGNRGGVPAICRIGVAMLELCKGAFASQPRPLLVVDDEALAAEVCQLAACIFPTAPEGGAAAAAAALVGGRRSATVRTAGRGRCRMCPAEADALLMDLGLVLQHILDEREPAAPASGLDKASLQLKARRLLAFACDMGWVVVTARLMPLAAAGCRSHAHAIQAIDRASASTPSALRSPLGAHLWGEILPPGKGKEAGGLSLLHRAVRSGSAPLVAWLLQWSSTAYGGGKEVTGCWRADRRGPLGVTPLHLAALLEDGGVVATMLLRHCPGGAFNRWVSHEV